MGYNALHEKLQDTEDTRLSEDNKARGEKNHADKVSSESKKLLANAENLAVSLKKALQQSIKNQGTTDTHKTKTSGELGISETKRKATETAEQATHAAFKRASGHFANLKEVQDSVEQDKKTADAEAAVAKQELSDARKKEAEDLDSKKKATTARNTAQSNKDDAVKLKEHREKVLEDAEDVKDVKLIAKTKAIAADEKALDALKTASKIFADADAVRNRLVPKVEPAENLAQTAHKESEIATEKAKLAKDLADGDDSEEMELLQISESDNNGVVQLEA